ncbi:hypothetical protein HYALB_00006549 [Hymenoscyphus albidus]|uniref:Uncharacterized protein n=1 Tax=Hymenoscyphus albidus TaxID=595503 RepID=A0A9N9QBN8_9HELO|nr:hypothetical protein HYALB_00006549 [Hymenoscyphus albidus]
MRFAQALILAAAAFISVNAVNTKLAAGCSINDEDCTSYSIIHELAIFLYSYKCEDKHNYPSVGAVNCATRPASGKFQTKMPKGVLSAAKTYARKP